jgi:hypothetical protein
MNSGLATKKHGHYWISRRNVESMVNTARGSSLPSKHTRANIGHFS